LAQVGACFLSEPVVGVHPATVPALFVGIGPRRRRRR
jgi:hypothetical protein